MDKLSFSQKNDLVVRHKAKKHFGKDLELFQKYFPSGKLMNDLARANEFTFERLDGQMLYILLDKISIDEILSNREEKQTENFVEEVKMLPEEPLDALTEDLQLKIEATEKATSAKKKVSKKNSPE